MDGLERKRPRLLFCALEARQQPGRLRSSHDAGLLKILDKATCAGRAIQNLATRRPFPSYGDFVRGLKGVNKCTKSREMLEQNPINL